MYLDQITKNTDEAYYDMLSIVNYMGPGGLIGNVTDSYLDAVDNFDRFVEQRSLRQELLGLGYVNTKLSRYSSLHKEMAALGLSYSDLNISLNVSNSWKIMLYKHFLDMEEKDVALINQKINDICDDGNRINAMTVIFQDLDRAFKMNNINVFPHEPYEIHPFDKSLL